MNSEMPFSGLTPDQRWDVFLDAYLEQEPQWLGDIRKQAEEKAIPIIRRETGYFLRWLLTVKKPTSILEIGTAVGYSALYMLHYAPSNASIVTIETDQHRIKLARNNIKKAGAQERITLFEGDAAVILPRLQGAFEWIFLDAAKAQYIVFLPQLLRLLSPEGILVTDNILQDGDTMQSRFAVCRRDRTIHKRMREYLYAITHEAVLETDMIPIGDGVAVSVRK